MSAWLRAHRRLAIFGALVVVQVLVVLGFIAREEFFLRSGTEILVESRPVDPRDPLRGDFIILAYDFERIDSSVPGSRCCAEGSNAYVWLEQVDGPYWVPVLVTRERPSRDERDDDVVVIRGRLEAASNVMVLSFTNINQIFVPQGEGNPPEPPDVRLVVNGDGTARVDGLEIDGEPWPR